jgi:hypothetical protein
MLLPRLGNVWLIVVVRGGKRGAYVEGSGRSRSCRVGQTAGLNPTKCTGVSWACMLAQGRRRGHESVCLKNIG